MNWEQLGWSAAFPGRGYGNKVDVVVGDTDPSSYAILYFQRGRSVSVKLYGAWVLGGVVADEGWGQQRGGNPCWALGVPDGALSTPTQGWALPLGPGLQTETFVPRQRWGEQGTSGFSELKDPLAPWRGHGGLRGRDRLGLRPLTASPSPRRTNQPGQRRRGGHV